MATIASRVLVASGELKIRKNVIERLPVELHDICIPAFVIGMALLALRLRGIVTLSMHPASKFPVLGNVLVAGETKARLGGFCESLMAIRAVLFELCVAFDKRARHNEFLEDVLRGCGQHRRANEERHDRSSKGKNPGNAASRSIKMDSDHMQDRRQNQEKEKRHVQDMPEREHAFVHSEPCCLVDGGEIEVEMLSYELQSFPAGAPAEPACLSLTPNGLFHLPQNALADVIGAPAKHQKGPDA